MSDCDDDVVALETTSHCDDPVDPWLSPREKNRKGVRARQGITSIACQEPALLSATLDDEVAQNRVTCVSMGLGLAQAVSKLTGMAAMFHVDEVAAKALLLRICSTLNVREYVRLIVRADWFVLDQAKAFTSVHEDFHALLQRWLWGGKQHCVHAKASECLYLEMCYGC
jgi:hypothetical protein